MELGNLERTATVHKDKYIRSSVLMFTLMHVLHHSTHMRNFVLQYRTHHSTKDTNTDS